jgi:Ni,Fe-hydrogenase I small subunit
MSFAATSNGVTELGILWITAGLGCDGDTKARLHGGIGGCTNVGGICIGCMMPGFPDKFVPFMSQPPDSMLSSSAVQTYGRAIHALRRFTQASLNKESRWRKPAIRKTQPIGT